MAGGTDGETRTVTTRVARSALFAGLLVLGCVAPLGATAGPSEYEVKAAYLVQFTRFITFPHTESEATDGTITIGVFGRDPSGGRIRRTIEARPVGGRRYRCVTVRTLEEASRCRVVYVARDAEKKLGPMLDSLRTRGVLTVGESDGFFDLGGMLRMLVREQRVRFDVNLGLMDEAGFQVSSNMLKVADRVHGREGASR